MSTEQWFEEKSYFNTFKMGWKVRRLLHSEQSKYQKIEVYQTESFGKLLLLDGKTMVSDHDEFVYHEVMAHIPYMITKECKKVLIIGGGDGGVVREFARHPSIEKIDLVEIDQRVIDVSREFFPHCTESLDDPRVTIHATDGMEFIKSVKNEYDVIIVDSTDPEDFASGLFTSQFYQDVYIALTQNGVMMNQTENPFLDEYGVKGIYQNMRKAFAHVGSFSAPMSIYPGVFWTFGVSSKTTKADKLNPDKVNEMDKLQRSLRWYNMDWHRGAFKLSNYHRRKIGLN